MDLVDEMGVRPQINASLKMQSKNHILGLLVGYHPKYSPIMTLIFTLYTTSYFIYKLVLTDSYKLKKLIKIN